MSHLIILSLDIERNWERHTQRERDRMKDNTKKCVHRIYEEMRLCDYDCDVHLMAMNVSKTIMVVAHIELYICHKCFGKKCKAEQWAKKHLSVGDMISSHCNNSIHLSILPKDPQWLLFRCHLCVSN